ncbi:GAF domain-containing SpoIIE family protein phosphatase [Nocardioides taihuensis]|uniref:GAF domain-containing SpoIIE family protein phosphatase n=1 Tax=Nocardioides taihuensis TaxID=1835606 RepID=A0ABW0BK79_9ACTN
MPGLGAAADPSFDRYARMVRRTLDVPVALVSLIEDDRQVFPGAQGLPEPWQSTRETPLTHSFCQYVVTDQRPLVVADARTDGRVSDNLAIPDLGVVAYAGWPVTDHLGQTIGSLCAIDKLPRQWSEYELQGLADLAAACSAEISERVLRRLTDEEAGRTRDLLERSSVLLALSDGLFGSSTLEELAIAIEQVGHDQLGCKRAGIWLRPPDVRDSRHVDVPVLRFQENARSAWPRATIYADMRVDGTNPIGEAFQLRQPLFFATHQDQNDRYAPHLLSHAEEAGGRAFLPLAVEHQVLGTLVLTWQQPRQFTEDDRITMTAMSTYCAQAVQRAMLLEEREQAAITLQNAALSELPEPRGLQLAARYRPAGAWAQVGGDWYDAVVLPSGSTALMIGDVVGHDVDAAAAMTQLRSTLRTLSWALHEPPGRVVALLEEALPSLGMDVLASLVHLRLTPASDHWLAEWTNAGHPAPLVVDADGRAHWLDREHPDVLLGVGTEPRSEQSSELAPGSRVLLYTDGLVERRGEHLDEGLSRLAETAVRHRDLDPDAWLDAIMEDLLDEDPLDDVAVLAVLAEPFGDH